MNATATNRVTDLIAERNQLLSEMRKRNETAEREGWTQEAREGFDRADARMDELENELASFSALEASANESAARSARVQELTERNGRIVRSAPAPISRRSTRTHSEIRASPAYRDAFHGYLRSGNMDGVREELRTAGPMLTSDTGAPVPTDYEKRIVELIYLDTTIRGICNVYNIDSDRTLPIESNIVEAILVAENATITPDQIDYGTPVSIAPFRFLACINVSADWLEDTAIMNGGPNYIQRRMGIALGLGLETYLVAGTGSSQPKGLVEWADDSNTVVTLPTGNVTDVDDLDGDDLWDCYFNVPAQYRYGAKQRFVLRDSALKVLRKIKTAAGSAEYVFKPSELASDIARGIPGTLCGVPYLISNKMPAFAATKVCVVFGNFEFASVFDRGPTRVMIDPYSQSLNGRVVFLTWRRSDFVCEIPAAFSCVKTSAT